MDILIISLYFPPDMGGASNRSWNAALGLQKRGHKVKVIAGFPHYPDGDIPKRYRGKAVVKEYMKGLEVFRVWVPPVPTEGVVKRFLIYFCFMWSSLFAVFGVGRIDGVFYVSPFTSTFVVPGLFYRAVKRVPLVLDCGDLWPNSAVDLGFLKSKLMIRLAKFTTYVSYRLADGIAPINDSIKRGIIREYGVPESKVHVVELGVDPRVFKPLRKSASLLRKVGLEGRFVVMYSGVLGPAYDFDVVLEAAKVLQDHKKIAFVVRGDGECKEAIIDKMKANELSNVVLLGKVEKMDEVVEYLNLADVFVLPMKNVAVSQTANPSKVYEYLACGKPVICCAEGEVSALLCEHRAGLAVKVGDSEALSKAILSMFTDRSERNEMRLNARKTVVECFSNQKVGLKLENAFRLARHGRDQLSVTEATLLDASKKVEPITTPGIINYFNVHFMRFVDTLTLLKKYVKRGQKVLDLGFFPGYVTVATSALGYNVSAVDVEPFEFARIARASGIGLFKCNVESEKLPFKDEEFDCVMFTEILEHINPWSVEHVVSEVHRILKNEGYLLISTPNLTALENKVFFLLGKSTIARGHAREYTLKEIMSLLSTHFEIIEGRYSMVRDVLTLRRVNGLDRAVREHVLKGFVKYRHWKNIGRVLVYPIKKVRPPLRSTIFVVARKKSKVIEERVHSLSSYRGFDE